MPASLQRRARRTACLLLALAWMGGTAFAQGWAPERRKDQYPTEPAYLLVPFPYAVPGIGSGIAVSGTLLNINESNADVSALYITGGVKGEYLSAKELFVHPRRLYLNLEVFRLNRAVINNYETRGMDSDANDFNLLELTDLTNRNGEAILTFFERRLEMYAGLEVEDVEISRVRDHNGKRIADLSDHPYRDRRTTVSAGAQVDLTDDRQDPRRGFRLEAARDHFMRDDDAEANALAWSYGLTLYVPVGQLSTFVLHHFRSDAEVIDQGETDPEAIRDELGLDCAASDERCLEAESALVARFIAERRDGSATSLGGAFRLRAYPESRYQGAHARFYGAEFRWNLTDEMTPFDYWIWKDIRTGFQVAFFYETGTVADTRAELGETYRSSYGAGARLITASGFVYRADFATGDEGSEVVVIFNYPF